MINALAVTAAIIQVSTPGWACVVGPKVDGLPVVYCSSPPPIAEAVMTRPIFEPVDVDAILQRQLTPPPLGRNRFRPKREPVE